MGLMKSFLSSRYAQKPIYEHLTSVLIEKYEAGQKDEILYSYSLKCLAFLDITEQYYMLKKSLRPLLLNLRVIQNVVQTLHAALVIEDYDDAEFLESLLRQLLDKRDQLDR